MKVKNTYFQFFLCIVSSSLFLVPISIYLFLIWNKTDKKMYWCHTKLIKRCSSVFLILFLQIAYVLNIRFTKTARTQIRLPFLNSHFKTFKRVFIL